MPAKMFSLSPRLARSRPRIRAARALGRVLVAALVLLAWHLLGSGTQTGRLILSSPVYILRELWIGADLFVMHGVATIRVALTGFALGCGAAFIGALLFCLVPWLHTVFRGVNIAIYTMPAIVIGPLLVLFFKGDWPQTILAALMVYFPAMSTMLLGLKEVDRRLSDLIEVYGGGEAELMRYVRLRGSLPQIFAGLRVAAPIAVLGAVLGEFGSGTRFGFGSFLLSTLPQANPARLWGIAISTSAIALCGYLVFLLPAVWLQRTTQSVTLAPALHTDPPAGGRWGRAGFGLIALLLPFVLWALLIKGADLPPIIAPTPIETIRFIFTENAYPIWKALGVTLPMAALGLIAGLAFSFVLAALSILAPAVARALVPVAMLVQNTPLVALVPFVVLAFGRGITASVFLAMLVVFFPAYVLLNQGFAAIPAAARDLVSVYGGSRWQLLWRIAVPYSISYFFAAAKMVAPMALLGVMVAEWLVSGVGLGNLLNISRPALDYETIWAGALVSILISAGTYELVGMLERKTRR
ncbi:MULTISPECIES: ABC transporter permease [Actibacterium]|uniref:ABC-type nitrate/sulfonate/bicarbonate transport system permease component n=1 Tax=Actibacterium naphthalenivorans TaxID=1614693 RepID=A0A840CG38_9RHOB|nr:MULTISPECIES: ABC transporter permease subunit [Actibacterium]MBB4023072.1 ABC-type nitrate/sulfonate/bicarbonate transport system permease component [Actibacterium naphthalenivorans]